MMCDSEFCGGCFECENREECFQSALETADCAPEVDYYGFEDCDELEGFAMGAVMPVYEATGFVGVMGGELL